MPRTVLSLCFALWVGLACPSLCAFTNVPGKTSAPKRSACCQHDKESDSPVSPADSSKAPCFCSGESVLGAKSYAAEQVLSLTFDHAFAVNDLPAEQPTAAHFSDHLHVYHPPDLEQVLPLLI